MRRSSTRAAVAGPRRAARLAAPAGLILLCAIVLAGCGGSGGSSSTASPATESASSASPSGTANAAVCREAKQLQSSLTALKNVDVRAEGTNGVERKLNAVRSDLKGLRSAASAAWRPQLDALSAALGGLSTAIKQVGKGNATSSPAVDGITTAAMSVATAAESLKTTIAGTCPGQ
ncbi:hypothetical protein [Actinopolymorpha cephalotaxi]|uniref:Lipoprotein n=1 Tax=Actinopolymorpha cephalotaxi TaxID=504797 RepID=A0ABX2S106_9ACTN|nr:hypothetical protein [Actinopolymorpha cephalotaxi]NYH83303.1 hypothetical protein [Actinopolymorpha cephalotaxi]